MMALTKAGLGEIASEILATLGQGCWYAIVLASSARVPAAAAQVEGEIRASIEGDGTSGFVSHLSGAAALDDALHGKGPLRQQLIVLSGLEDQPRAWWERLNFLRSRLIGDHAVVWILSEVALRHMEAWAPDLDALLRASTWQLDEGADLLTPDEKEHRLDALRQAFALDDAEVIARAERGELTAEPAYVEWLTLLDRGDLLAPR